MEKICVVGLGRAGLPTAALFASKGCSVLGVDTDSELLRRLKEEPEFIEDVDLRQMVRDTLASGKLTLAGEPEEAEAFVLAVPAPLDDDRRMDFEPIEEAADQVWPLLKDGNLVVLQTTVVPGTTVDELAPVLARCGLVVGDTLLVSYTPSRFYPGQTLKEFTHNPCIIGGLTPQSGEKTRELFSRIVESGIVVTDATTAETAKLLENIYRDVNVALANETAMMCRAIGVDVHEVIHLANMHPRVHVLSPGPGVGGRSLPVDPWRMAERNPGEARLIRTAREVNDLMPVQIVYRLKKAMGPIENPRVAVLGLSYKEGTGHTWDSPALKIVTKLRAEGMTVVVHDPHVPPGGPHELHDLDAALKDSDCVAILAGHDEFRDLDPKRVGDLLRTRHIFDGRGILDEAAWSAEGFTIHRV